MALLSPASRRNAGLAAASGALLLAGCYFVDRLGSDEDEGPRFSHRIHVEDQGLDCSDCHVGAEDSDEPGMPVAMQCALCHVDLDAEKPPEEQVASRFVDGEYVARSASALADEVIFSHLTHVDAGAECSTCHGAIETTDSIRAADVALSMSECMDCHANLGVSQDCATCHREIRADRAPPSHELMWLKVHGDVARAHAGGTSEDCTLCHTENSCSECHLTEMPPSHTNYWRRRGHGQIAAFDRDDCSTCHQPDACNRCHEQTLPVSHRGTWGGTRSTHCFSCHFPLRAEGCFTCHKDANSHQLATPLPANHFPGMDCRQCHGLTAPLPHVDNGTDCEACHR
jgi:hypothetical protein